MIHSREIIRWYRTTHCKSTWVQHHSASPGPASSKHFTSTAARTLQHLVVQVRGRSGESTPRCPQGLERDEPSCLAPPSSVHFSGVSPSSDQVDPFSLHVRIARKPIGSEPSILGYPPTLFEGSTNQQHQCSQYFGGQGCCQYSVDLLACCRSATPMVQFFM